MLSAAQPASGILYLHGFNSAAGSPKARLMRDACTSLLPALPCETPTLTHRPEVAFSQAQAALDALGDRPLVAGSSMGGFFATCLAERFDLPAVLINPAVRPVRLIEDWLGENFINPYTGERFRVEASHRSELEALTLERIDPARYLLLLGTADETLDCADAFHAYAGCRTILHPGGDHGFSRLIDYLPAILAQGGHRLLPEQLTALRSRSNMPNNV